MEKEKYFLYSYYDERGNLIGVYDKKIDADALRLAKVNLINGKFKELEFE